MGIEIQGNVNVDTLNTTRAANGNTQHQGSLETICQVISRNELINQVPVQTFEQEINRGKFMGFNAGFKMPVRSCHGDPNLVIDINGVGYNAVEPRNNPAFHAGSVEVVWGDYAAAYTTDHVPDRVNNMAAIVEFNCEAFTHQGALNNLQLQRPLNNQGNVNPRIPMQDAPKTALPEADGARVLWHILGDFFVYSPDHYGKGYIVVDSNNDLLQTKNFF